MLIISKADRARIIDHCRAAYPDEACGILAGREEAVSAVYPMRNARPGPASYEMDPAEQFQVLKDMREKGLALVGIFHSHPAGPASPSATDVENAYWPGSLFPNYPEAVYVIVSLQEFRHPVVRGFSIREGTVREVPLTIVHAP